LWAVACFHLVRLPRPLQYSVCTCRGHSLSFLAALRLTRGGAWGLGNAKALVGSTRVVRPSRPHLLAGPDGGVERDGCRWREHVGVRQPTVRSCRCCASVATRELLGQPAVFSGRLNQRAGDKFSKRHKSQYCTCWRLLCRSDPPSPSRGRFPAYTRSRHPRVDDVRRRPHGHHCGSLLARKEKTAPRP